MKKNILIVLILFAIILVGSNISFAVDLGGQECLFPYSPYTSFNSAAPPVATRIFYDISTNLPNDGQFYKGTTGWLVDTSGLGLVISYATTTSYGSSTVYGEIGLRCQSGETAFIDIPAPISISTSTSGAPFDWDELCFCVHYRAAKTPSNLNRIVTGKFTLEIHDAYDTQIREVNAFDAGGDTTGSIILGTDSTFVTFADQPAQQHHDWFALSHFKLIYSVPSGAPTSEILITRVILFALKFARTTSP